jgi:hypothetical protein
MFSCVIVEDVPFEEYQVQKFEEDESNSWLEEGKWFSPPTYSILS